MYYTEADPESLLKKPSPPHPGEEQALFSWTPAIAFLFLTVTCGFAVYGAWADPSTVSFIVSAYSALLALLWCLRRLDGLPRDGTGAAADEARLKFAVWLLFLALNGMFSFRVAEMLPPALAAVVWTVAAATTLAGIYAFFIAGTVGISPPPSEVETLAKYPVLGGQSNDSAKSLSPDGAGKM